VEKETPTPQVPEPSGMLTPEKAECKTFLIYMQKYFHRGIEIAVPGPFSELNLTASRKWAYLRVERAFSRLPAANRFIHGFHPTQPGFQKAEA
jgi:hypothetical protein